MCAVKMVCVSFLDLFLHHLDISLFVRSSKWMYYKKINRLLHNTMTLVMLVCLGFLFFLGGKLNRIQVIDSNEGTRRFESLGNSLSLPHPAIFSPTGENYCKTHKVFVKSVISIENDTEREKRSWGKIWPLFCLFNFT